MKVLAHLAEGPGIGHDNQVLYGPVRLSLLENSAVVAAKSSSPSRLLSGLAEPV